MDFWKSHFYQFNFFFFLSDLLISWFHSDSNLYEINGNSKSLLPSLDELIQDDTSKSKKGVLHQDNAFTHSYAFQLIQEFYFDIHYSPHHLMSWLSLIKFTNLSFTIRRTIAVSYNRFWLAFYFGTSISWRSKFIFFIWLFKFDFLKLSFIEIILNDWYLDLTPLSHFSFSFFSFILIGKILFIHFSNSVLCRRF